jgi:hypothetical protein
MHTRAQESINKISGPVSVISNFGGYTKVELTTPDAKVTVTGEAECSAKDNFNRKIGNSIALGRALEGLPEGYSAGKGI